MKELKDIVLKKGDKITFTDGQIDIIGRYEQNKKFKDVYNDYDVTKIERPTQYKTIYEAPKQILDQKEKEYLEAVIRPFRNRQIYITKISRVDDPSAFIQIKVNCGNINLPLFDKGTMYKGMELNRAYLIDELDLFVKRKTLTI